MTYCDIHTHKTQISSDDRIVIVNKIVDMQRSQCFLPGCLYSYGIHPWYITDFEMQYLLLTEAVLHPSVVAIGEAGLDKQAEKPIGEQVRVFSEQAKLAAEMGKPLVIHCVKAWDELLAVRKDFSSSDIWVIHGFRGNRQLAEQLIRKGLRLSFGEKFNPEALRVAWPDYLFLETDESDKQIEEIYRLAADSLDISIDLLALTLRRNVKEVFSV